MQSTRTNQRNFPMCNVQNPQFEQFSNFQALALFSFRIEFYALRNANNQLRRKYQFTQFGPNAEQQFSHTTAPATATQSQSVWCYCFRLTKFNIERWTSNFEFYLCSLVLWLDSPLVCVCAEWALNIRLCWMQAIFGTADHGPRISILVNERQQNEG